MIRPSHLVNQSAHDSWNTLFCSSLRIKKNCKCTLAAFQFGVAATRISRSARRALPSSDSGFPCLCRIASTSFLEVATKSSGNAKRENLRLMAAARARSSPSVWQPCTRSHDARTGFSIVMTWSRSATTSRSATPGIHANLGLSPFLISSMLVHSGQATSAQMSTYGLSDTARRISQVCVTTTNPGTSASTTSDSSPAERDSDVTGRVTLKRYTNPLTFRAQSPCCQRSSASTMS